MCGILGTTGNERLKKIKEAFALLKNRGGDGEGIVKTKELQLAHCLHSIVGKKVLQPFQNKEKTSLFAANCEVYNWKELAKKYNLKVRNDAELVFFLLEKEFDQFKKENKKTKEKGGIANKRNDKIKKIIAMLDGDFAFVYKKQDMIILARDKVGVKPLWYSKNPFAFSSEKKALTALCYKEIEELNPRKILFYNQKSKDISFEEQNFFVAEPEISFSKEELLLETEELYPFDGIKV